MLLNGLAALAAVLVWWASTVCVFLLARRAPAGRRRSFAAASALALAALAGVAATAGTASVASAGVGFGCALVLWAWHELGYLTGIACGPRREACPDGVSRWRRFRLGVRASLWHELAIVATAALLAALTWDAPNRIATWTFVALWLMRWSAKLNLFFGVPNLRRELWPEHLRYLSSYAATRPFNLFFPVSVSVGTAAAALVLWQAFSGAADPHSAVGLTLLGTLLALAVLEHWLLVLPLPDVVLARWSESRRAGPAAQAGDALAAGPLTAFARALRRGLRWVAGSAPEVARPSDATCLRDRA